MSSLGARHHGINRKIVYRFQNKEEWRESAIKKGFTGMKAMDLLHRKKGDDGLQWIKDLKHWMEFKCFQRSVQDKTRAFILKALKED